MAASIFGQTGSYITTDPTQLINVKDFPYLAKGDGVSDDTAAIQAALDFAASVQVSIAPQAPTGEYTVWFPKGRYKVSSLDVGTRVHLRFDGGVLTPVDTTTPRSYLVKFVGGHSKVEKLVIDNDYAMNYSMGSVWIRSRHNTLIDPEIWTPTCAFTVGDPAWEGVAASGVLGDSENKIIGGEVIWGITVLRAYGQNTIVNLGGGFQGYSNKLTLPGGDPRKAAWEAQTEISYINCGAVIFMDGMNIANFSGTVPVLQSRIQIVSAVDYVNSYGKFHMNGVNCEGGYLFECASNGAVPIQDAKTKMLVAVNCAGYVSAGRAGYYIECDNSQQMVDIRACNFYGNTTNNIARGQSAKIHIDEDSFADLSVDIFQAILSDKPFGYSDFTFIDANTSAQAMTGAFADLVPTVVGACDFPSTRVATYFSAGVFTAPVDMRDVTVIVGYAYTGSAATDENDIRLVINGANQPVKAIFGGASTITFKIYRLLAGQTLKVQIASIPNRTLAGTSGTYLKITGKC